MDLVGTSPRSQAERTGQEDRRLKIYGLWDMLLALVLASEGLLAALEQLVAPLVVEGLGDLVLAADVAD